MIQVIALIVVKPGLRAEVLETFKEVVLAVRAEDGCIDYAPFVDIENFGPPQTPVGADTFVVIEKWRDAAALAAHVRAPHVVQLTDRLKDKIADRTIHLLKAG
jgi:quinol monooxygenase YgiN